MIAAAVPTPGRVALGSGSVREEPAGDRVSRAGTARGLVLLGSGLLLAASAATAFLALVFAPVLLDLDGITGSVVLAVVAFAGVSVVSIALANLAALRSASTRGVVIWGCGTLVAGAVIGVGTLLALLTRG